MLCDDLERWDGWMSGRLKRERVYIYIWGIYKQQKQARHYKVIILQFKKKSSTLVNFSILQSLIFQIQKSPK